MDIYDGSVFSFFSQPVIKLKVPFTINVFLELSHPALWTHLPESHCTVCGPSCWQSGAGLLPTPSSFHLCQMISSTVSCSSRQHISICMIHHKLITISIFLRNCNNVGMTLTLLSVKNMKLCLHKY